MSISFGAVALMKIGLEDIAEGLCTERLEQRSNTIV